MRRWLLVAAVLVAAALVAWQPWPVPTERQPPGLAEREVPQGVHKPILEGRPDATPPRVVLVEGWALPVTRPEPGGGIVLRGHVIDPEGRGVSGGVVLARAVGQRPEVAVRVPVRAGRFEVRFEDRAAGRCLLAYQGEAFGSAPRHLETQAGTTTEGVELVAESLAALLIRVEDAEGRDAPDAEVELRSHAGVPVPLVRLDGQARAEVRVRAEGYWTLTANRGRGRWRGAWTGLLARRSDLTVRLQGPWAELPVRVVSRPPGVLAGKSARVRLGAGTFHEQGDAVVDGRAVGLPVPSLEPEGLKLTVRVEGEGQGERTVPWGDARAVDAALRLGVEVSVAAYAQPRLRVVDAAGEPLAGFEVHTDGTAWRTDLDGLLVLAPRAHGPLTVDTALGPLATVSVDGSEAEQRIVVPQASRISGRWKGPPWPTGLLLQTRVVADQAGQSFGAEVDLDAGRWWASLPLPSGTPVRVSVEAMLTSFAGPVDATTGRDEVDLDVDATALVVVVRQGRVVRPTGSVRLRDAPGQHTGIDWAHPVTPAEPMGRYGPVRPGRYLVSFQPHGGGTWIDHPHPIEVGRAPVTVTIDFGEP